MIKQAMRQHNAPKALLPSVLEIARPHAVGKSKFKHLESTHKFDKFFKELVRRPLDAVKEHHIYASCATNCLRELPLSALFVEMLDTRHGGKTARGYFLELDPAAQIQDFF